MGQLGFFDLNRRYEGLDAKNHPLVGIAAAVPFETFRPKLKAALVAGGLRAAEAAFRSRPQKTVPFLALRRRNGFVPRRSFKGRALY